MIGISVLKNPVQRYPWGSGSAIQGLLGVPPERKPIAELWMGAHPKAPSKALTAGKLVSLEEIIRAWPERVLGPGVSAAFSKRLPFLLKVLAVSRPLSIQAHPNLGRAKEGYARENRLAIPIDSRERNYRDECHKPELICALTDFQGMIGFREPREILQLATNLLPISLPEEFLPLENALDPEGIRRFITSLLKMENRRRREVVRVAGEASEKRAEEAPVFHWIAELARLYPGDIAVLSPLIMNLVQLRPGQALFIPSGELHSYLKGMAIELMANSDNVVRGGLTRKHVDVEELVRIVNFEGKPPKWVLPVTGNEREKIYPTPAAEFLLSAVTVSKTAPYASPGCRSVEILLCTEGEAEVTDLGNAERLRLAKGTSMIVPAAVPRYRLEGNAIFYKASVPLGEQTDAV